MPFLLAMVKCEGTEATLFSCVHSPVGAGPCDVGAGVVCQGEITINTIQSNLFQLSYMSIIIIIHCIFLNEKSKRICRNLNKLIRDIPRIIHNQFT